MWARTDAGWGLIRPDGTWQVEPRYEHVSHSIEGFAGVKQDGRWHYVDVTGQLVMEQYFPPGGTRAAKRVNKLYGLIDRSGAWVVEPKYDMILPSTILTPPSWWQVKLGDKHGLLDETGQMIASPLFDHAPRLCDDGRIIGVIDKKPRLFARDGVPIDPPEGELTWPDSCDAPYVVKVGAKFGYTDSALRLLTSPKFDAASSFSAQGRAVVKLGGKFGVLKRDWTWAVEPKFDAVSGPMPGGVMLAMVEGKGGIFDVARNDWVVAPKFDGICPVGSNLIMAVSDGKRGLMDPSGAWLTAQEFERFGLRFDDGIVPAKRGDKWEFVDMAGIAVGDAKYDDVKFFDRGVGWAKTGTSWCPIDRRGRKIPSLQCQDSDPTKIEMMRFDCRITSH